MMRSRPLSELARGRDNNFNLLRFLAASLVVYSHSYPLTGANDAEPFKQLIGLTGGTVAVDLFFVTSGFLVCGSFYARGSLKAFVWSRVLRLFPALAVVSALTVFGLGPWFTALPLTDYFGDVETWKFFIKNIVLVFGVDYQLPGVFTNLPYPDAVNGSLWTLPIEVEMYTRLAVLGWVLRWLAERFRQIQRFIPATYALLAAGALVGSVYQYLAGVEYSSDLRLFYMFFVGAACYVLRARVPMSTPLAALAAGALLLALADKRAFYVIYYVAAPYLVLWLAYVPHGVIRQFNRIGDYSYGIYIYAFPVQQTVAALMPGVTAPVMFAYASVFTLAFAVFSWYCVEKPALRLKGRLAGAGPNSPRK